MKELRACTAEEIRETFLKHCHSVVNFWLNLENKTTEERIHGAIFSILAALDGSTLELPAFAVIPLAQDDKEFYIKKGRNWIPEFEMPDGAIDISGSLHELYCKYRR